MNDTKTNYYISVYALIISFTIILVVVSFVGFIIYGLLAVSVTTVVIVLVLAIICLMNLIILLEAIPNLYRYATLYFKKIPALQLTEEKLIDNINNQSYNWKDVKSISIASVRVKTRINFIAISLVDSEKYFNKISNPYKKFTARFNEKYFQGAFSIQPNLIKCKNDKLFEDLTQYFERQKISKTKSSIGFDEKLADGIH